MNRRGEVIDYVTQKYGREQVAQIITFGTMAAQGGDQGRGPRAGHALRRGGPHRQDGARPRLGMTHRQGAEGLAAIGRGLQREPQIKSVIDTAKKLEGMVRNAGVHAAGVVISPVPLDELVPLYKTKNDEIVTAYDMKAVEKMGLLKMDFLGLTTLTIIDDCLKLIEQTRGAKLDLETLATRRRGDLREGLSHRAYQRASSSLNRTACATCCAATSPPRWRT